MTTTRHRPGRRRRRRRIPTSALIALAVAVAAGLMIGMVATSGTPKETCPRGTTTIGVTVSPDIAPAIMRIAGTFNRERHLADGKCLQAKVTAAQPAVTTAQIDGQMAGAPVPAADAWIPDSSLWIASARRYPTGAQVLQPAGFSVATSPLLLVMPPAAAARTPAFATAGWSLLLPASAGGPPATSVPAGFRVELPDPAQNAAGLAALVQIGRLLGNGPDATANFTRFAYSAGVTSYADGPAALRSFVSQAAAPLNGAPVTITTEQAVVAYDRAGTANPLAARYPSGQDPALGSPELDYPYVVTTSSKARADAAATFGQELRSSYAAGVIRFAGFRSAGGTPDAFPAGSGLDGQLLQVAPAAGPGLAAAAQTAWDQLAKPSRVLAAMDISGAMAATIAGGVTYEQELAQTAQLWLELSPDATSFGLWEFASQLDAGQPYKELVPVGPLAGAAGQPSARQQLQTAIAGLRPSGGSPLALYGTILAAYQRMRETYQASDVNSVIVLTSGQESSAADIGLADLLSKLASLTSAANPIAVNLIVFGNPADLPQLQQIAETTGGRAYQITDPAQVGTVFWQTLAGRLCTIGCVAP